MKNLKALSIEEVINVNGGCQIGDCGQGPIIVINPDPSPTYPENPGFGDPSDWDPFLQFPVIG